MAELPNIGPHSLAKHIELIEWRRLSDLTDFATTYSMWGTNGISPADLKQGHIGDCWAISAFSSMAEFPERFKDAFLMSETNDKGIYAFRLHQLGLPVTVTIDDYLPFARSREEMLHEESDLAYSRFTENGSVWAQLLEKAFAKYLGSYESLVGGYEYFAYETILGAHTTYTRTEDLSVDELWEKMVFADSHDAMISAGSKSGSGGDSRKNEVGISYSHGFSVHKAVQLADDTRLLQVRNPWHKEYYNGTWSDSSEVWTEEVLAELGHTQEDDGFFYIPIEDFPLNFGAFTVARDVNNWSHSHVYVAADDAPKEQ